MHKIITLIFTQRWHAKKINVIVNAETYAIEMNKVLSLEAPSPLYGSALCGHFSTTDGRIWSSASLRTVLSAEASVEACRRKEISHYGWVSAIRSTSYSPPMVIKREVLILRCIHEGVLIRLHRPSFDICAFGIDPLYLLPGRFKQLLIFHCDGL